MPRPGGVGEEAVDVLQGEAGVGQRADGDVGVDLRDRLVREPSPRMFVRPRDECLASNAHAHHYIGVVRLSREPSRSEITPEALYLRRREFIKNTALAAGHRRGRRRQPVWLVGQRPPPDAPVEQPLVQADLPARPLPRAATTPTSRRRPTQSITTYNNFYEFGVDKDDPARNAHTLQTRPWSISVEGEVANPQVIDIDTLLQWFPLEQRIYRMRCVEAWSMVIPWLGFPLADLIKRLEPTANAKFVEFTTLLNPEQMPGERDNILDWPYVEGLRMDEAMHPLTLMAVGLYGKMLPNQNGAPIRLVVPWKYGFKGVKSIVKIRFTDTQPQNDLGAGQLRTSTASTPTSIRRSTTRAGARPPSAASARSTPAQDAAVQRLRRPGRQPVRRHGPAEELLSGQRRSRAARRMPSRAPLPWLKPGLFVGALAPLGLHGRRGRRPTRWAPTPSPRPRTELGLTALVLLVASLACTPASKLFGWTWTARIRRELGLFAFFYAALHFLVYLFLDQGLDAGSDLRRHRQATLHHRRLRRVRAAGPAGAHVDERLGATPGLPRWSCCTSWSTSRAFWPSCTSSGGSSSTSASRWCTPASWRSCSCSAWACGSKEARQSR